MDEFTLRPPVASIQAGQTDLIFFSLLVASLVVTLLVIGLMVLFCVRYRDGSPAPRRRIPALLSRNIEFGWTLATLLVFLLIFGWASSQDFQILKDTPGALTIQVLGKQWMWKTEHPGGQREINALHVPSDTAVRLVMNSQDVIHSFYVPALRLKHDVVPGLTEVISFTATRNGTYPLYCAEYCGTDHSKMLGTVTVMTPEDYARWLNAQPEADTLASAGAVLFRSLGCSGCHLGNGPVRAPNLAGLYGRAVPLVDGRVVSADDAYIRDSILLPKKDVAAGYPDVMPSFAGRVDEGTLIELVAYIRSLTASAEDTAGARR